MVNDKDNSCSQMKALFLDDMEERHTQFEKFHGHVFSITHVYGYQDCADMIFENCFDIIFLDHDLSESAFMCDPDLVDDRTGTDVAQLIVQCINPVGGPGIVLHSLNPIGRKRMFNMLYSAGFDVVEHPFYNLIKANIMTN